MTSRKTLFAALAAFALLASPAIAGNGNGNGGGHGNSGGNGNGNGGGNSGKSGTHGNSGTHGKSASAKSGKKATTDVSVDEVEVAATPKEKNIHAKLGRLNSLQRNINAYLNSKSPKFAAVQAYVTASAVAQNAQAALDAANQAVIDAQAAVVAKQAEFDAANLITPPSQADLDAQAAEIAALQDKVTEAQTAADLAKTEADTAAAEVPSLDDALADMANKPVDAEVTDWAKDVLADKIDQMAAKLAPATP